jgi:hypothetical protein
MNPMRYQPRRNQRGFALLLVFALAAAALIMLYLEMPRVAFEHQRDKEALLIERGEEYVRAIQLYVQKFQKYPQRIEDLESTNNVRFLRKRFRDPVTGEEEWRLIHVDAAGQYVDSLVHKRQDQKKESTTHVLQSSVQGIGVSAQVIAPEGESQCTNPALRRTASDRIIPGLAPGQSPAQPPAEGDAAPDGQAQPSDQFIPPQSLPPAQPGSETPVRGEPGSPGAGPTQPGGFRMPGNVPAPGQGQQPPSIGYGGGIGSPSASPPPTPGMAPPPAFQPGISGSITPGGLAPGMMPPQTGQPGFPGTAPGMGQPTIQRPGAPNEALQAIQRILTRQPAVGAQQQAGMMLGGGIAGVASKADMDGIRTYNDRTNYKEWEFLFDFRKALQAAGIGAGQPGQPGAPGQGANPQASPFERPPRSTGFGGSGFGGSAFGGAGSQGNRGGFGSFGGNQPQPAPAVRP